MASSAAEALAAATTSAEIVAALARGCWWAEHGDEPPAHRVPTEREFVHWLFDVSDIVLPAKATEEAEKRLATTMRDGMLWAWTDVRVQGAPLRFCAIGFERDAAEPRLEIVGLTVVHERWLALPERRRPRHPLAPLVDAWQRLAPVPAEWDARRHTNLPAPLVNTRHVVPRQDDDAPHLPIDWDAPSPDGPPRFEVGYLPTLEPEPSRLVPSAFLSLWDDIGLGEASRGRGGPVPVPRRIGMEVLIAASPEARADVPLDIRTTMGELAAMVWPGTKYVPSRHGPLLRRALRVVHNGTVEYRDGATGGLRVLVAVTTRPRSYDRNEPVGFITHLPPGSIQGPHIDTGMNRTLAARSNRQHRAMVTAWCLWDRYATVNGALVSPSVPTEVRRDVAGYILDANGHVATERDGRPSRSPTHPRAVQIGKGRADRQNVDRYYPALTGRDLILLCHPVVGATPAERRMQRFRTHETLVTMRDAGLLDFEAEYREVRGGGELVSLRLLPTPSHAQAHAARWAANKYRRRGRP